MRIALGSDLHLEFGDITLSNTSNADVLVLSGDICVAADLIRPVLTDAQLKPAHRPNRVKDFFDRCSAEFPCTVYVAGNHEFYNGDFDKTLDILREECSRFDNIYFLERDHKIIGDILFIGTTLWTDCNNSDPLTLATLPSLMNDFVHIHKNGDVSNRLLPQDIVLRHKHALGYIEHIIGHNKDKKVVVVGHHAPNKQSVHPRYKNDFYTNAGYSSDLTNFILDHPQIKLWTMGHTHHVHRYYVGDTLVVCNPRGYIGYEKAAENFKLRYIDLDQMPAKFDGVEWNWN